MMDDEVKYATGMLRHRQKIEYVKASRSAKCPCDVNFSAATSYVGRLDFGSVLGFLFLNRF